MKKIKCIALALAVVLLSAACADSVSESEQVSTVFTSVSENAAAIEETLPVIDSDAQTEQTTTQQTSRVVPTVRSEVSSADEQSASDEPSEEVLEQTNDVQTIIREEIPESEDALGFHESVPQSEYITQESQTSQAKPPAEVVIPTIASPSSPKTAAFVARNGYIDYSNASQGYISVCYTGDSDRAKLRMICGGVTYDHDVTIGTVDYFPLSCGSGSYTLQLYERAEGKLYALVIDETAELSVDSELNAFLLPNHYVWFEQNSACVEKSAELCAGAQSEVEKLAAVFGWLTENVSYDRELATTVQSGYCPNPDSTLSSKKGICFDYASLFSAMTRAQGIPTRLVVGYAADNIYHAWNEVYTDETGWITPQLLLKNKGYNIVDATFYASAADKGVISDYISNEDNYAAIYYY